MPQDEQRERCDFQLRRAARMREQARRYPELAARLKELAARLESDAQEKSQQQHVMTGEASLFGPNFSSPVVYLPGTRGPDE